MFKQGRVRKGTPLAFLLVAVCALAPSASAQSCYQQHKFSESLHWLSGATWVDALQAIAVVDPLVNRVKLFSPTGVARPLPNATFGEPGEEFLPAEIERTQDGFALSMVDGTTLFLDEKLGVRRKAALATLSTKGGVGVRSLYQWTVADGMIVGFGTIGVKGQSDKYQLGVFRSPMAATNSAQLLLPFENGDYYVLGHEYFTSLGSRAYFMLASDPAAIYEVFETGKLRKLNAFPPAFRSLPELKTELTGPKSTEPLFAEIEDRAMPVGLFGYEGMLYLLTRHPVGGVTEWLLYQINPKVDRIVGEPMKLPTATEHLSIVTAPDRWFLIERGKVLPLGKQKIETFVTLPASWITSERSPLRGTQGLTKCQTPN